MEECDSARRATANKRLHVNQRVSGALGEHMEGPTKPCRRLRVFRHIVSAVGEQKYLVCCPFAVLRVEKIVANLPQCIQVPVSSNTVESAEAQEADDEIIDQDEEEALLEAPEVEEAEATAELEGEEGVEEAVEAADDSQPSRMIGQLPTEQEAALASGVASGGKDYAIIKK
jgi:hypothetical protein